jgi:hypothetical protein
MEVVLFELTFVWQYAAQACQWASLLHSQTLCSSFQPTCGTIDVKTNRVTAQTNKQTEPTAVAAAVFRW